MIGKTIDQARAAVAWALAACAYILWRWTRYAAIAGGADVEGARGTGNTAANILEVDFADKILELDANVTPLLVLSKRLDKGVVVNPKYTWFEDEPEARFDRINNGVGYANNATAVVVDNAGTFHPDDLVYVSRTGEMVRVTAVNTGTNTLTIVRGVGSTAAALVDNDELIVTGSAAQEGALDKPAWSRNPVEIFNYTQIFRDPYDMTGTARSTKNRVTPHDWARQANRKAREHAKHIEYAAMLGRPSIDTSGAHPRRTTGGWLHYATQNITDVGGTMTESEFFSALSLIFRHGSKTKLAMAARVPVDVLHTYPRTKLHIEQSEETYGIRVVKVITPHGQLNFVTHWLMEGDEFSKHIWIVDLMNCGYRYLHGDDGSRDTKIREEIQSPGADGRKDEILTECGFTFGQPKTHGRIVNITG